MPRADMNSSASRSVSYFRRALMSAAIAILAPAALALDGQVQIHDPSTVVQCDGKYYCYGTGGLPMLISDDEWTWRRGGQAIQALPGGRPGPEVLAKGGNNSWAPDVVKLADRYCMYYSVPRASR